MPVADGYATVKSTYDARGNADASRAYHGVNGEPVRIQEGWLPRT